MGYKCAVRIMKRLLVILIAFAPIFVASAANVLSYELSTPTRTNVESPHQVTLRYNTKLRCGKKELYLYKNRTFKLISGTDAIKGTFNIEDGENLVLSWGFFESMNGKIYFKGGEVLRVVLGEETFWKSN